MYLEDPLFIGLASAVAGAIATGLIAWPIGAAATKHQVAAALKAATIEPVDTEQLRLALDELDEVEQETHDLLLFGEREGNGAGEYYEQLRHLNNRLRSLGVRTVRFAEDAEVFEILTARGPGQAQNRRQLRNLMQAELAKTKDILCRLARDLASQRKAA